MDEEKPPVAWRPQAGPQHALVQCPFPEILFGGARGGGKTDGILGKYAIKSERYGEAFNAIFFRREMPQTDDLIERAKAIYLPIGAEFKEQTKMFRMPGGGRIRFRPLYNVADAQKYQGQNLTDVAVEEAGNYPSSEPIDMIFGAMRSTAGVPTQMILTANPGGPGQGWIKHRYIDPAPLGMKELHRDLGDGVTSHAYCYIPSRVADNRILLASDPRYVDRLRLVGNDALVRAWLNGDWSVVAGAFFPEFNIERHVISPRTLPRYWSRIRSFDWGSARPFSVGWWAVSDGELPEFPRGAIIRYREWYGAASPNVGLKLTAEQIADGIKQRERDDPKIDGVADPAIFSQDGGPSIAERMAARGVFFRPADNARVGRVGALGGWDQVRSRLRGEEDTGPGLLIFSTCMDLIRTFPMAQHDQGRPEDLDTNGEDHALDECRYACMARPYTAPLPVQPPKRNMGWAHRGRSSSPGSWAA